MRSAQGELASAAAAAAQPAGSSDGGTIYVLLPIHNRRAITEAFVRCLLAQTDRRFHLVLIDDGSTDGSAGMVTGLLPDASVIRGRGTWWWAGSLQQGYLWLKQRDLRSDDIVLIANDDTGFDEDFLALARTALAGRRRSLLLACLHDPASGALLEVGVDVDWARMQFAATLDRDKVNCFSTRGLFMFAPEFVELGGFHPHLLPHYGSDYEFTIRARRAGFALQSDPRVKLWYDETTTGIRVVSRRSVRDFLRSTLSTRSTSNPFYWTTFLILSCPRRHLARNIARIWRGFLWGLRASLRAGS